MNVWGRFKSSRKAGLLSLLFPGVGDFYMGHRKLAALELVVVAIVWVAFVLPNPEYPMTVAVALFTAAVLVIFLHVPDAVRTWFLARSRRISIQPEGINDAHPQTRPDRRRSHPHRL